MAEIQEFGVVGETVTATMTLPTGTGEHFGPPLSVGFYPGQSEVWLQIGQERQSIPLPHLPAVIKQLRRAAAAAKENAGGSE